MKKPGRIAQWLTRVVLEEDSKLVQFKGWHFDWYDGYLWGPVFLIDDRCGHRSTVSPRWCRNRIKNVLRKVFLPWRKEKRPEPWVLPESTATNWTNQDQWPPTTM